MLNLSAPLPTTQSGIKAELTAIKTRWDYLSQRNVYFPFEAEMAKREEALKTLLREETHS